MLIGPGRRLGTTVVASSGIIGGAESWLLSLVDATDRLDLDVIALSDGPLVSRLAERGIDTTVLPTGRSAASIARSGWALARHLRERRPEVVLANGVKAAASGIPAAAVVGVPSVWVKHDLSHDRLLGPILGRAADRVIAVSSRAATAVLDHNVTVIEPGGPAELPCSSSQARTFWEARGLRLDPNRRYVATVGRLVPDKGIDDVVAALSHERARDWDLVVIGGVDPAVPGERARLRQQIVSLGLGERVHFTGSVAKAGHRLAAFDAVAVISRATSRRHGGEGYSLVAVEAALAGVPLIATDAVPAAHGLTASNRIVPQGNPVAVAEALAAIDREPATRVVDSESLARRVRSWEESADRTVACLASAASRPGAGLRQGAPVSVVSTILNEGGQITELLSNVTNQLRADDQFVVVDGGSVDDTVEQVRSMAADDPRIDLVLEPGSGISGGRNAGRQHARNDVIVFTDAGCQPDEGWLDSLRLAFAESTPPALVSGTYEPEAAGAWSAAVAAACYPRREEVVRRTPLVRLYTRLFGLAFDATMPTGRSSAFRAEVLDQIGGFDEGLATAEDVTLGRRVADLGGECLLHAHAAVRWQQREGLQAQMRMWYAYGVGDGLSGDPLLIGRNLSRAVAYVCLGAALRRSGRSTGTLAARWRIGLGLALAIYTALPVARLVHRPHGLRSIPLIPWAFATKDIAKVAGCAAGLLSSNDETVATRERRSIPITSDTSALRPGVSQEVAILLPTIGLDGRSRVLVTLISMLNDHGVTPEVVTFGDAAAVHSLSQMASDPLLFRIRQMRTPVWAKGALLQDLALSRSVLHHMPPHVGYVLLNTADVGFDPRSHVVRYVTFPAQQILEYEERYQRQPMQTFGRAAIAAYGRMAAAPSSGGVWLVNSQFIRGLTAEVLDVDKADLEVVYGPVTIPDSPPAGTRRREVVSVGGFHPDKRQLEQLDIAAMLPDIAFTLIGSVRSARYLRDCERRAADLPNVSLMVSPETDDLRVALTRAKVFLHTKHFEHQGLSTAEGIGHGCVPVVHDSGGQREVVPDPALRFGSIAEAAAIIRRAVDGEFDGLLDGLVQHVRQFDEEAFRSSLAPHVLELVRRVRAARTQHA